MKQTIIFDFDGTLADSFTLVKNILLNLSEEFGYKKPTENEIIQIRSTHPKDVMKMLGLPSYKLPFLALKVKSLMQKHIKDVQPIHGIGKALFALKLENYSLGIVTSNSSKNVQFFLREHNLDIFDFIQTESSIFGKARGLNQVLKKQKLNKNDVIYVGDEIRDIEAAKKVGMKSIAVSWGYNDKKGLQKYNPNALIDKAENLLISVQNIN